MSKRKPFNDKPGYKCSLKVKFGYVVLYDRYNKGDWIHAKTRWVVIAYDKSLNEIARTQVRNEKDGRDALKDARDGFHPWTKKKDPPPPAKEPEPEFNVLDTMKTYEVEYRPSDDDALRKGWETIRARSAQEAALVMGVHIVPKVQANDMFIVDRLKRGRNLDIAETTEFNVITPPDFRGEGMAVEIIENTKYGKGGEARNDEG